MYSGNSTGEGLGHGERELLLISPVAPPLPAAMRLMRTIWCWTPCWPSTWHTGGST